MKRITQEICRVNTLYKLTEIFNYKFWIYARGVYILFEAITYCIAKEIDTNLFHIISISGLIWKTPKQIRLIRIRNAINGRNSLYTIRYIWYLPRSVSYRMSLSYKRWAYFLHVTNITKYRLTVRMTLHIKLLNYAWFQSGRIL